MPRMIVRLAVPGGLSGVDACVPGHDRGMGDGRVGREHEKPGWWWRVAIVVAVVAALFTSSLVAGAAMFSSATRRLGRNHLEVRRQPAQQLCGQRWIKRTHRRRGDQQDEQMDVCARRSADMIGHRGSDPTHTMNEVAIDLEREPRVVVEHRSEQWKHPTLELEPTGDRSHGCTGEPHRRAGRPSDLRLEWCIGTVGRPDDGTDRVRRALT